MFVETRPASPEVAESYHKWYNETHAPEIVAVDGFVSARRFEPVGHDGPFVAVYEIDSDDDIEVVKERLTKALSSGQTSSPVGVELDPPPTVRYFREILTYDPGH
jgi:hypothetical protein